MARSKRSGDLLQFGLFCGIILFVNILAGSFYTHFDLTEEKRFTLTRPTREMLKGLNDRIYVRVLLDGEFPAGFKRLQTATREMLDDFRSVSAYIDYQFENPNAGSTEEINARRQALMDEGIAPINLRVSDQGERKQQLIYPVAVFHFGSRKIPVNLLENQSPSLMPDEVVNNSVSLLEYKFANAIKKLLTPHRPIILFTRGHGELDELQTADLEQSLSQFYETGRITLDSSVQIKPDACALLIIAKPTSAFSERDKFKIDQYIMQGGKVLWLIDRLNASLDSMRMASRFVPTDFPLNLEDILFKYGVRLQPDLVLDLECTKIPLQVGRIGNSPQYEMFPWYYHPAVLPAGRHPVVKNLDRVELRFCSSIDTIRTKTPVNKTILLRSSKYSRLQFSPIDLNFEILKYQPDPSIFNKGPQTTGVLLEGIFSSNYENRVSEEMMAGLKQIGVEFRSASVPNRMIVISDGDVAANFVRNREEKEWYPLGYNNFEKATYANKELLLNAIEYLLDASGVIEARSKEVKLRLLDSVKARDEQTMWQAVNLGAPLVFLGLFGVVFFWRRKRRYAK
ncbi:MAG: gliding motility-associated ABC transporter substrate-binding protein GldG [Thermoanaerobaculia bacterium]|nr:gliding motility-associated ABC transporter substrate-binding protein GldG [Thermoanaerobaculia bacterium]